MLLFIMLITALNLLFSELHSSVICATKFFSEMLSIKSTYSYAYSLRTFDGINILGCCKSLMLSTIQNVLLHLSFVQNIGLRRNADGQVLSLFKSSKRTTNLQSILEKVISVLLSRKFQEETHG